VTVASGFLIEKVVLHRVRPTGRTLAKTLRNSRRVLPLITLSYDIAADKNCGGIHTLFFYSARTRERFSGIFAEANIAGVTGHHGSSLRVNAAVRTDNPTAL